MVPPHRRGCAPHLIILSLCILLVVPVSAGMTTTEVTVTKLAADGVTVLNQETVDWQWMKENLPVIGDGETTYYTQGPIFEDAWNEAHPDETYDPWNPTEDVNLVYKDHGEFMGTDVADLLDLVGGAEPQDSVKFVASDGLPKEWPAEYIYSPNARQGPFCLAWYHGSDTGYVNEDFTEGMRLYFLGETTNADGMHVWGNWDMHESWAEEHWYYYSGIYPSAAGVSVQNVKTITIYSDEEPTGSIYVTSTPSGATVFIDDEETDDVTPCTLSGIETGTIAVRVEKEGFAPPDEEWVNVAGNTLEEVEFNLTPETGSIAVSSVPTNASITLDGNVTGLFTDTTLDAVPVGEHTIELEMPGYRNATRTITVEKDEYSILDVVLFSVNDTVTEFATETANATGSDPDSAHPPFAVLGPFDCRGQFKVVRASVSTGPDGTAVDYQVPAMTTGRWYLYIANRSAGAPTFMGTVPDRRYVAGVAETYATNLTRGYEAFAVHSPPGVSAGGLLLTAGQDENASLLTCWIGEGALAPSSPHPVRFEGTIDTARADSARLTVIGSGNTNVTFNGHTVTPIPHDIPGEEFWIQEYDVLSYLNASVNEIRLEQGDAIIRNIVLTVITGETVPDPPEPKNPWEDFIARIFSFLNSIFPFFGSEEETPSTPEQNSTFVAGTPKAPVPKETRSPPVTAPGADQVVKNRSGGLYVTSHPPGMTIVVDNRRLIWQTPHIVYGLREGLHNIRVEKSESDRSGEDSGFQFETVQAWVYPDAITPVHLDGVTPSYKKTIRVDSEAYRGEKFTVNGLYPAGTIPGDAAIEGAKSWITVSRDGAYHSYAIPYSLGAGRTFRIEPGDADTVPIIISSNPEGAAVFTDGFLTGKVTPCRVEGLSPGQHRILVSKPGYIPAEDVITIPEGARTGGAVTCTLREYIDGDLLVESTVPDARIYLHGRYTGEKTPHTFTGMSIGTYEVRVVTENESRTIEDVLVNPGETTRCLVTLKEEYR